MEIYPINKLEFTYTTHIKENSLPIDIEFRVLSKKELLNLHSKYFIQNSPNNNYKFNIVKTSVLPEFKEFINDLSDVEIDNIYKTIINYSTIQVELINKLHESFTIVNHQPLQTETFDCDYCKETGYLQKTRNCGFLTDCKDCNEDFVYVIDGNAYKQCPKSLVDMKLLKAGYDCYYMYNKGLLPESGGMLDQTEFFNEVSVNMFNWLKKFENDLMKQDE